MKLKSKFYFEMFVYRLKMRKADISYWFRKVFVYAPHRAKHGWASNDVWSFDGYMTDVIIGGLTHLKNTSHSYPSRCKNFEEWQMELDEIIKTFTEYKNYEDDSSTRYDALHKKYGIPSISERMEGELTSENFVAALNDTRHKLPDAAITKFFKNEAILHKDIKKRMHKLIDDWENLWD